MSISESTVRRLEADGLPFTPVGAKSHRYNLAECKAWLKANQCQSGKTAPVASISALWPMAKEFTESCRKAQLRVLPS
jgi:hypothetical protein